MRVAVVLVTFGAGVAVWLLAARNAFRWSRAYRAWVVALSERGDAPAWLGRASAGPIPLPSRIPLREHFWPRDRFHVWRQLGRPHPDPAVDALRTDLVRHSKAWFKLAGAFVACLGLMALAISLD